MFIVDAPQYLPGSCFVCGLTPEGPYIDTEYEDQDNNRYYICMDCLNEIVRLSLDSGKDIRRQFVGRIKAITKPPPETHTEGQEGEGEETKDKYICKLCGRDFGSQNALNGHITGHKKKGEWIE